MSGNKETNTGTFIVKIMNHQKSTWQGSVTWVEEEKTQCFRSALELIRMLDEAVGTSQEEEQM